MKTYEQRVEELENEGLTTSDAQGVVDAEDRMQGQVQHTPGPWGKPYKDVTPQGFNNFRIDSTQEVGVSVVALLPFDGGVDIEQTQEANARLIAAAPELLEAARLENALDLPHDESVKILEAHGWCYADRFDLKATEFVARKRKAAIAKATK